MKMGKVAEHCYGLGSSKFELWLERKLADIWGHSTKHRKDHTMVGEGTDTGRWRNAGGSPPLGTIQDADLKLTAFDENNMEVEKMGGGVKVGWEEVANGGWVTKWKLAGNKCRANGRSKWH
jgi:hypothetical protein